MRIVGDIHGKFESYKLLVEDATSSIQIGDFGFGFGSAFDEDMLDWQRAKPQHRFIRGNHDDPGVCRKSPNFIEDGLVENDVMFIGGAWSIDRDYRIKNLNWWSDEECSYQQFEQLCDIFPVVQPRVVFTHDCPTTVANEMFCKPRRWHQFKTLTGNALEEMFQSWKPELWIFGHWHFDADEVIDGTRFICLNELSHIDIDLADHTGKEKIIPWLTYLSKLV